MTLHKLRSSQHPTSTLSMATCFSEHHLAFWHSSIFFFRMTRTWQPRMRRAYGVLTSNRASRRPWQSIHPVAVGRLSYRTKARCTVSTVFRPRGFPVSSSTFFHPQIIDSLLKRVPGIAQLPEWLVFGSRQMQECLCIQNCSGAFAVSYPPYRGSFRTARQTTTSQGLLFLRCRSSVMSIHGERWFD